MKKKKANRWTYRWTGGRLDGQTRRWKPRHEVSSAAFQPVELIMIILTIINGRRRIPAKNRLVQVEIIK